MPSVPRQKYPEMNWRAADKVAAWKPFKRRMNVIFVADQIPEERQWALILVAGDRKKVDQVWGRFQEELRTMNFILAFQRHVSGRLHTR